MRTRSARERVTTGALVVLGIGSLLAASLSHAPAQRSGMGTAAVDLSRLLSALDAAVLVVGVVAAVIVTGFLVWTASYGRTPRDRSTLDVLGKSVRFVLLLYLLVAVLAVAVPRLPSPAQLSSGEEATATSASAGDRGVAAWWPLMVLVSASAASLATLRLLQKRRDLDPDDVAKATRTALAEALHALDAGESAVDDVVIAAYQRMEGVFRRQGLVRRRSETTAEFVGRVVTTVTVDEDAARLLTAMYERARFGNAPLTGGDRAAARAALARLVVDVEPGVLGEGEVEHA